MDLRDILAQGKSVSDYWGSVSDPVTYEEKDLIALSGADLLCEATERLDIMENTSFRQENYLGYDKEADTFYSGFDLGATDDEDNYDTFSITVEWTYFNGSYSFVSCTENASIFYSKSGGGYSTLKNKENIVDIRLD